MQKYFRLEPADDFIGHAVWEKSKIREACWVKAETERDARLIASSKLGNRTAVGLPSSNSPWENMLLVTCVIDLPPLCLCGRSLITASGETFF